MARRGYKSNEDAAEFFKKMQEVADGKRTATSGNTQQQQLASKEALTEKPVVTPAVPSYQAPVAQPMGVQGIIGQANVPAAMAATGAAAGARMAAQPMANAILRPGDPAWKRNLALGGMDNLSQEQLLMAREQANMDARSGQNPYDNMPQAPDTGKTVWWNAKKGQGSGKTTANYVIGRADKAIERGDYKAAMQAIEYGINAEMSANDRQKLTDYIKAESFGGTEMRDRETAGTAQQVADAWQTIGKTNAANWESWKAQNLNDDVMRYLAEDYGIEKYKDADELAKKLTQQIRRDDDRRAWQQQLTGMREGYLTQNASAAFAQRGREEVARAQQDGAAVKTVQRYMQAQQAVTVLDWLADKLAINKPGRPADVDSQEVQLAVRALRAMGVNVPELNDQNYYDVVSGLREQEQTAVSQNWDVLEQRGYDVDLMAAYTARTTSKAFEQGLRALPKREMGVIDKVLASIASVPFSVYVDPFIGVANALQVAGDGDVEDTGNYVPTVDTYDQPGRELRGQVAEGIGSKGWQFGYNALMSTADSVVGAATMGEGYTVAMGLSSMGAEIQNAIDHGASGRRALVYGAAKGAIEILTEYVSTEKLVDMLKSTEAKTLIGRMGEIATQGATEGSEEMASDILGGVADAAILRGTSDHKQQVRELMSKGYSAAEAEAEVMADEAETMMESGLAGALSGMMGAGFAEGVNAAKGTKLAAEQIAALSQSNRAEDRLIYKEICELAGVEYSMSDNKKMEVLEEYLREQRDNAKAAEKQRKATERAVAETADEMIRNAAPEVPGLAMNELTMDTVEEDTETILQAAANALTSQEAASAVKLAQDELAWISNAAALGRIEKDVADDLANRLEDMIQSERARIGTEEREQAQQEQEIQNFFREEETDEETDEDVLPDAVTGTDYLQEDENDEEPESIGDSQQREADLDPGRQTGRMGEGGRGEEEKSAIRRRAERAAEIRDGIRTGEIVPQSGQEVGISFAAEDKTIWVLPEEITDRYEDLKGIKEDAEANGYELTLVAGDIRINRGGNLFHADAVIETDDNGGKRIILRADTRITDPVKNYNHEMWHAMVAGNRALQADILSQMREQYTDAEIYKMVYDYGDAFNWVYGRFTEDMTEEEANALAERYLEETLADAYGEIQRAKADNAIARDMVSRNAKRIAQERATQASGVLDDAKEMEAAGENMDDIAAATGWRRNESGMWQQSFSASAEDEEYLEAVEEGDTETAQRMVDQAARNAGYKRRRWHQTNAIFNVFNVGTDANSSGDKEMPFGIFTKRNKADIGLGEHQMELFVRANNTLTVTNRSQMKRILPERYQDIIAELDEINEQYGERDEKLTDDLFDAEDAYMERVKMTDEEMRSIVTDEWIVEGKTFDDPECQRIKAEQDALMAEWNQKETTLIRNARHYITGWLRQNGYDSMEMLMDQGTQGRSTDALIVLDAEQVKLAAPVTYDDEGNVIPLSKRFDDSKKDIRFSASEEDQYEADRAAYMDALMADNLEQLMRQEQEERNLRKAEEQQRVEEARASRGRSAMRHRAKVLQGDAAVLDAQRQAERAAGGETGNAAELVEADRRARQESIARRAAEMERQNERNREAIGKVDRSGMTPEEAARSRKIENAQKRTIQQLKQDIVQLERDIEAQRRVAEVMRASNEGENPDAAILERREESARAAEAKERALRETLRITEDALARKQRDKTEAKFDRDLQQIEKQAKDWTKKHLESQIKKAEKRLVALEQAERAMREAGADVASTVAAKEKTAAELRVMREAMRDTTRGQRDKAKREEKKRRTAEKKKTAAQQAKTDFINDVLNTFQIGIKWRGAAAEALAKMADQLASTGTVSEQERNLMLKALIRRGEQWLHASNEAHAAWDSYHGSRFYVPAEVRAEFGESWDAFQASAWKVGVELTDNETDQSVRDWEREFYRDGRKAASDREALEDMIDLVREGFGQKLTLAEIMGRNQQQYGMSVRDQVSQMRSALDRMLNVFAEKAQLEYRVRSEYAGIEEWANKQVQAEHDRTTKRLRIADQKLAQRDHWIAEHLNEELKKKQERAARQTLFDDVKRLEKLARKQDPKTQEAVRKLIGKLDTVARWVSPKGLENLQAMAAMYHEQQAKEGSNWEPDPYIEARIARLNQVQIDSLPIEDVRTLVQDVMALTHAIQTRNKMLSDLKFEQREKMALEIKKEIWGTKGTKVRNKAEKFLKGVLMEELLRPKTFLNMISGYHDNGAMASMIRAMENGQTKQLDYAMKAEQIFDEFTRNAENREWLQKASSDKAEWLEVLGVRMAPMMKIALYMNSLNFQNRYHIIHGGVKIPGEQAYRAGMKEEAEARGRIVRFTPAQLKSLKSTMSAQELAYARMLTKYFDGYSAKEINETSMELYGFERATTTNYYPITVVNEFKNDPDKVAMQTVNNGSIEGNRHLQERKSKSATPIKLISANQTLLQHVDEMSKFCGMAIPLRDFSAILSFAFPDFGSSVTETIGQRWGEDGKAYVEKLIKDIQGDGGDKNRFDKIMANIRGKMAGATLSFNPGVTLSQFASLPGAAATLGVMPLVQGMKLWERVDTKLIEAYTPLLWYRSGGAEEELQQLSKKKGIMEKTGWWLGGNWISKMDKFTVGRIWKACEYKVMTELGMQPGDAETVASGNDVFYRNVAELFNRTVYDTQPNYTTLQRTQIGRTKSEAVKMLNMYKTVPYQYYNMMFEAGGRLRAAKGTKKWNEAVKFAARSFGGVLVANMTYVLMKQVIKGLLTGKWPDEEEGMTMEAFGLDLLDTYAGSVMGMSELVATIEEFTGVKQAGYINSDSNIVIGLYDEIKDEIQKLADADDWTDVLLQGKSLAKSMSKLLGVPAGNFEKYIVGSVRQVFPEAGAYYDNFFKEIEAKQLKQKTGEEFRAGLEVLMDNRTDGVADETIEEIQRLWEAGYDTIPKAIPSSLKDENDDEIKLTWGTKKAYRQIWSEAVTGTIDDLIRTDLYQAADDETKAIMINNLYTYAAYGGKVLVNTDYAPNSSEKWISAAVEAQENGIDLAEYIAWRVTNAGLDGKNGNGDSVDGLKDQRQRELLEETNWSDDQKAAVYGGQVSESKAGKLDELYNAGLDYQQANAVANAGGGTKSVMTALEMQGLNDQQRYRAAMVYAGETESKKLEAGQEFGVKPSQYAEVLRNADANGNGKVSQQEAEDYISGMSISIQQKAYLWQLVTDGKDGTKNPFGQTFGAEFYEWMHRNDE